MPGGKYILRTNLALLAISGTVTLTGVLMVAYGGSRVLPGYTAVTSWAWPVRVLGAGICGVLLFVAKSIPRPRKLRWILGGIALLPLSAATIFTAIGGYPNILALALPSFACAAYSIVIDEPDPKAATHDLLVFLAAATLALIAPLNALLAHPGTIRLIPQSAAWGLCTLGFAVGIVHARNPLSRADRVLGYVAGACFIGLSLLAYVQGVSLLAVIYAPIGIVLLLKRLFRNYLLGSVESAQGLSDENVIVRQFQAVSELMAWGVFLVAYVHQFFAPTLVIYDIEIFLVFIAAYLVFTFQYRLLPPKMRTFENFYRESLVNAVLLGLVCHVTGGLLSPYAWFFIPVLFSGSVAPQPKRIMHRLYVILAYYAFECLYTLNIGALSLSTVIDNLMPQVFLMSMTGLYAYHLAARRQKIDADLMETNRSYLEALKRETSARELTARQAETIGLTMKRDEALLSSLADGVVALDDRGLITLINPVAQAILGFSETEALGGRLRDLLRLNREGEKDFRLGPYIDTALHGNAIPLPEDLYQEKPDGKRVYLTGVALPILDERKKPTGAIVTLEDTSYLHEVDQLKTNFLSVAAHQLRTPLSTIRWYLELINDPAEGKLKQNQKMFAENAYTSLLRMVGLINRLLAITRLEGGRVPFRPQPTDLKTLTQEIIDDHKRQIEQHGLSVRLETSEILPTVALDPTLAREAFVNLIENAIRYTPDGGKIAIEARDGGEELIWTIRDTGIGIPKEQQPKIFEKFFRASNAIDYSSEGNGLGLYLANFIVTSWNGILSFESEEGKGATFRVTVPKAGMKPKEGQISLNA